MCHNHAEMGINPGCPGTNSHHLARHPAMDVLFPGRLSKCCD
jgi:hypothetical protein